MSFHLYWVFNILNYFLSFCNQISDAILHSLHFVTKENIFLNSLHPLFTRYQLLHFMSLSHVFIFYKFFFCFVSWHDFLGWKSHEKVSWVDKSYNLIIRIFRKMSFAWGQSVQFIYPFHPTGSDLANLPYSFIVFSMCFALRSSHSPPENDQNIKLDAEHLSSVD